jgi:serine kinase of HPr protein (carbohydrate metabolism regulator)
LNRHLPPAALTAKGVRRSLGRAMTLVHGTCIALADSGVLLRGPPGSGKSDLALRLFDLGARLLADDQVCLSKRAGELWASAPPALAGLLEVRGIGLVRVEPAGETRLRLVVDLLPAERIERLPEQASCRIDDVELRQCALAAFEASAPQKVRLLVHALDAAIIQR